jgi:glycosyltransferase involved in cell wall biosynthesis
MKIAFLSTFYPYRGGIAQFNAALFHALEKENQLKAFTFSRQYPDLLFPGKTQYTTQNDQADEIPALRTLDSLNPFTYYSTAKKINQFEPDLLIISYWMPFFAPSLGMVAKLVRKKGTKVISILHNIIPHEPKIGDLTLNRFFVRQNDACITLSQAVAQDLQKLSPTKKHSFHPHPIYEHFGEKIHKEIACERLKIPKDKKTLLFFGLIRDYKGLDILLEAFDNLSDEYILLIAGECYGKVDKYLELISKNKNKKQIFDHIRYIPDQEVPLFFSAADLLVLPYRTATQSGVVAISYHFDLPVIVTDVGSLKELVGKHEIGLVVSKPDSTEITVAIQAFFDNDLKPKFQKNIKQFKTKYSWDSLAKEITNF